MVIDALVIFYTNDSGGSLDLWLRLLQVVLRVRSMSVFRSQAGIGRSTI